MTGGRDSDERSMFAQEMIAMRKQCGWNQEALAAKMIVSSSTVANIESGYRAPTPAQAVAADEAFGTPGTFQRHERRMRGIPFSAGFRPFQPYEEQARVIRAFEHSVVPGLFQTRAYAQVVLEVNPETTEDAVKEQVDARLKRQEILFREEPKPPRMHVIIDEQVLYRETGGPAVMAEQMAHLAELARRQRISIQIFPSNRHHPGLQGAFAIAETGQEPDIVYIDSAIDGQVIESKDTAEKLDVVFRAIQMEAFPGSVSLAKIEEAAQRWMDMTAP